MLAFLSEDAAMDRQELAAKGMKVSDVMVLERPVEIPGYSGTARFRLVLLETPENPLVSLFLTEHLTPEVTRFAEFLIHPNDARGIASVTIVADDPQSLKAVFQAFTGKGPIVKAGGTLFFEAGFARVEIIASESFNVCFPGFELEVQRPYVLGQCLSVGDIAQTTACLRRGGIAFGRQDGMVTVAPNDACGVLLQFRQI